MQNRTYTTCLAGLVCLLVSLLANPIFAQQTQWIGPAGGDWFDDTNWTGGKPSAGHDGFIGGGSSVVIGSPLTVLGFNVASFSPISLNAALDNQGTFEMSAAFSVGASGSVVNRGTFRNFSTMSFVVPASFTNETGASFSNSTSFVLPTTLVNKGQILNNGTIDATGGTVQQTTGSFENNQVFTTKTLTVANGSAYTNNFGSVLNISGAGSSFDASGFVTNNGTINNAGVFSVKSILTNNVAINNLAGGTMIVFPGIQLNNGGTVNNKGTFTNNGIVQNGNQFQNENIADNYGAFNNNNVLDNRTGGQFTNRTGATLDGNFGTNLLNNGTFVNQATMGTFGQINNNSSFTNNGQLSINTGATLNNNGNWANSGTVNSTNAINNNGGSLWSNSGLLNINSGCIFTNAGTLTNNPTGNISNFFELVNSTGGQFNNNGRVVSFVRIFINAGTMTNNGYLQNQGDVSIETAASIVNNGVFDQFAGNLSNKGTLANSANFINDDCSSVCNKTGATINNSGGLLNNRGIVIQRGSVIGNSITNNGGFIHTGATSTAPALCKNVAVSADVNGEVKVYATGLIAIANIDSCQNILYTANGIPRPLFSCADIGTVKSVNVKMITRLADSLTCVAQVTPIDVLAPNFSNCPPDVTIYTSSNSAIGSWTAPTALDNCTSATISSNFSPGAVFNIGITGVTYTATDLYGNAQICQFRVSVIKIAAGGSCAGDVTAPVFAGCPANRNVATDFGSAAVSWVVPTLTDGCLPISLTANFNPGNSFPEGPTLVKYTARDGNGNSSTCQFTVTVTKNNACATDNVKPTIVNCPANIYLPTNVALGGAVAIWATPAAGDNCALTNFSSNFQPGSIFPTGQTTVIYTATDGSGNTASCSFLVTVGADPCPGDVTAPVFSGCPANISLTTNGASAFANWTAPTAADPCGPVTLNASHSSGQAFPVGNTQVIYQASDKKGNKSTCAFNISVSNSCLSDVILPVISGCPANLTVPATGPTGGPATWILPTATDNCGIASLNSSYSPGSFFTIGQTIVGYTATDLKGNTAVCQFQVTVVGAPVCTPNASPINNATAIPTTTALTWNSAAGASSYDVYLGTANPPTTLAGNSTTTSFSPAGLIQNTKYYWFVVPKNVAGAAVGCSSGRTNFTTTASAPTCANIVSPANNATNQAISGLILSWNASATATNYDVFLGTTNPPTTLAGNVTTTNFTSNSLANGTTYFWKIVPKNAAGSATNCSVNQFSTAAAAISCAGNLIVNGGFEGTSNSQFWNSGAAQQTSTANSGAKSWGSCQATTESGAGFNVPVSPGLTYKAQVYSKISGSPAWAGVGFDFYTSANVLIGSYVSQAVTSTSWTLYTFTRTAPAGAAYATVSFWKGLGGCQFADDFCLTQVGTTAPSCKGQAGSLLREYWNGISGLSVTDLTGNLNYPNSPTGSEQILSFSKGSVGDNYGTRVRGYLRPSTSGQYIFFVSGDDNTELFLSTNADPLNKVKIASVSSWTNANEWYKFTSQKSVAISLFAEQDYYVELLHKEAGGGDHFSVNWCPPGVTAPQAIPQNLLSSYLPNCTPVCNKNVLLLVDNLTLNTGDQAIKNRLQSLGLTVTTKTDEAAVAADANGKGLIYISSTCLSTTIGTKFTNVAVPLVTSEVFMYDELKMTGTSEGTDFTEFSSTSQANMLSPNHPISGGLSGWQTILTTSSTVRWGKPSAGATRIGEIPNQPNKELIFCYETGASMVGLNAPARRVGLFLTDNLATSLTTVGWKLFDNSIKWAMNCSILNPLSHVASTSELVFDAYKNVENIELKWISRTGERNDFFEIERSQDESIWQTIGEKMDGKGEANSPLYFRSFDENPLTGRSFYRLRLVFEDGSERLSETQVIDFQPLAEFELFPNPTSDDLFVNLKSLAGQSATLRLFDINGRPVQVWQLENIVAEPLRLPLAELAAGQYVLWIFNENRRPESRKLTIQK